ncbi:PLATZ transcription factor family protein [Zostera marina]|uniref:PLATZ transcription factor family protein n=1 Tax=Zostera marina TaxID=29655 RepID=A0A0K9PSI4_ZOSMR|nr:PLATZ transcription factor family protein [Zostera marina]
MAFSWKPTWLEALNTQKFFVGCSKHEFAKKNDKNICCLDCCTSICPHCLPSHHYHRVVQVRRYVYHDVVRLQDLEKLIDCSNVQSYTINSSKVVFIKKRPQNRHFKGSGNFCTSCDRCLQEPYIHCSLGCKVDFVLRQNKDISPYLRTCDTLQSSPDFLVSQDTNDTNHSTVMEGEESMGSSDTDNLSAVPACTSAFVKKKRSSLYIYRTSSRRVSSNEEYVTNMSKRKGIPHRSPLC